MQYYKNIYVNVNGTIAMNVTLMLPFPMHPFNSYQSLSNSIIGMWLISGPGSQNEENICQQNILFSLNIFWFATILHPSCLLLHDDNLKDN